MKHIFLESHNIDNLNFGFGQFNYHLIKAMHEQPQLYEDFDITINAKHTTSLRESFNNSFSYNTYSSISRHKPFRIKKKYDLWHSMNQNTKVEPFFDIPYLMTIHDVNFMEEYTGDALIKRKKRFEKKLQRSNALVYISKYAQKMTHTYFDIPDIPEHVIYNGNPIIDINIPESHQPKNIPSHPYIFSIGEFLEKKNFHTLVEMLMHLPEIHLVLAGKNTTNYAKDIQQLIEKHALGDRVMITGKISEVDKYYYYKNCLAFVFPSLREGFGIPPIEAMAFGKPVFLSGKSSLPEIGGSHAFYWEHFDPKYMAKIFQDGMNNYTNDKENYQQKYQQHAASYNWKNTAKKYIEVYKELLS